MRKSPSLVALFLVLAVVSAAAARDRTPPSIVTPATVRLIESRVVMPGRAEPLANYDRYYLLRTLFGVEIVHGRFVLRSLGAQVPAGAEPVPDVPGAFTVPRGGQLPQIADDGRCAVVSVYLNVETRKFVRVQIDDDEPGPAVCGQPPF